jgi:hypothetical protein
VRDASSPLAYVQVRRLRPHDDHSRPAVRISLVQIPPRVSLALPSSRHYRHHS